MNKFVWTLIGIPASGKSTWIKKNFSRQLGSHKTMVIEGDAIREELYGDANIQGDGREVFGLVFERYTNALKDTETTNIVLDFTSLTWKLRKRYLRLAETICPMFEHTLCYNVVYFEPNLELSLKRNSERERKVPNDVIERMFNTIQPPTNIELDKACVYLVDKTGQIGIYY